MNPLRKKLAVVLTNAARRGITSLHPDSSCAKSLKGADIGNALNEDIKKICKVISFHDALKILSLASSLRVVPKKKRRILKAELKEIAKGVFEKTENKSGKLRIPDPCRYLMLDL